MYWFAILIAAFAAAQQPTPSINYTLPGQVTPAPPTIPPNAEILAFQSGTIVNRPSAAARHFLLANAPRITGNGITFTARCLLDRATGRVTFCLEPTVPAVWRAAASGLASLYQFRLTPAQMASQGPLAVTIQDRIVPADVRPAARLFTYTVRPPANVVFAQGLTAEQSQAYYPSAALEINYAARVRIDCQVQPDLSLFCVNPSITPGNRPDRFVAEFQRAALQLSGFLRSGPNLANGAPAPGTVFRTTIIFNVPEQ